MHDVRPLLKIYARDWTKIFRLYMKQSLKILRDKRGALRYSMTNKLSKNVGVLKYVQAENSEHILNVLETAKVKSYRLCSWYVYRSNFSICKK